MLNRDKGTPLKWRMKNNLILTGLVFISVLSGCKKDKQPVIVHSGTTRIDYNISQPDEIPHITFQFNTAYDLTGTSFCTITLITNEQSVLLNLSIMLEDEEGNRTDVSPFIITSDRFIRDNKSHIYSYNFETNLESSTAGSGIINLRNVKKILVYINAGNTGVISEGSFWLDKIRFEAF